MGRERLCQNVWELFFKWQELEYMLMNKMKNMLLNYMLTNKMTVDLNVLRTRTNIITK